MASPEAPKWASGALDLSQVRPLHIYGKRWTNTSAGALLDERRHHGVYEEYDGRLCVDAFPALRCVADERGSLRT